MRLIDADALKEAMTKDKFWSWVYAVFIINDAPTVDVVKHGSWDMQMKRIERDGYVLEGRYPTCSCCGYTTVEFCMGFKFCPNCGAKMDEVRE